MRKKNDGKSFFLQITEPKKIGQLFFNQKYRGINNNESRCFWQSKNRKKKQNEKKNLSHRLKSVLLESEKRESDKAIFAYKDLESNKKK